MRSFVVLLAASLVGADRADRPGAEMISYQIKILDMEGLDWRSSLHSQLQPVARQGSATVWTATRETAARLAEKTLSRQPGRVMAAPKVTADPRTHATVFQNSTRKIVGDQTFVGQRKHASFVGFMPRVEDATEGWSADVSGRAIDQGVLTTLKLENREITAVHNVRLSERGENSSGEEGEAYPIEATIQVPEYARTAVSGEWLVPKDGVLVVGLGVHTVADAKGKAVVRERLAVIEAEPVNGQDGTLRVGAIAIKFPAVGAGERLGDPNPIPLPVSSPLLPSRSLPLGVNALGQAVPLPPLPEEKAPVSMRPGTSEPCATPQARTLVPLGEPTPWVKSRLRDTETNPAGFRGEVVRPSPSSLTFPAPPLQGATVTAAEPRPLALSELRAALCDGTIPCSVPHGGQAKAAPSANDQTPSAARTLRFAIPLNANFKIVIDARLTQSPACDQD